MSISSAAGEVTAGLAESNGSLRRVCGFGHLYRLTAEKRNLLRNLTPVLSMGLPLRVFVYVRACSLSESDATYRIPSHLQSSLQHEKRR